jgi:hypothetical protein
VHLLIAAAFLVLNIIIYLEPQRECVRTIKRINEVINKSYQSVEVAIYWKMYVTCIVTVTNILFALFAPMWTSTGTNYFNQTIL